MAIRVVETPTGRAHLVMLPEDEGFLGLLPALVPRELDVEVVRGRGWTSVYQKYDEIAASGIDPSKIVPVLDADTLGEKGPTSSIDDNVNVFRFYRDLEFAFSYSPDLFLAHALLAECDLFGSNGDPDALRTWMKVVNVSRVTVATTTGIRTLAAVVAEVGKQLEGEGRSLSMFQIPSKVALAARLGEICRASNVIPHELDRLALRLSKIAGLHEQGSTGTGVDEKSVRSLSLTGQIIVCSNRNSAHIVDLDEMTIRPVPEMKGVKRAGWSPDGNVIAGTLSEREGAGWRYQVIIVRADGREESLVVPLGTNASFRCWSADSKRLLARVPSNGVMFYDLTRRQWIKCEPDLTWWKHCLSSKGHLARARWAGSQSKPIQILKRAGEAHILMEVPGAMDASFGLAWSNAGDRLAFVNQDEQRRASICIWHRDDPQVCFLTPWVEGIRWVSWSPDDRFLLFCRQNDVCVVSSSRPSSEPIPTVTRVAFLPEPVLSCCAWRSTPSLASPAKVELSSVPPVDPSR